MKSVNDKPKPWFKRLSLTTWIFIALILGVLAGMALQGAPEIADTYIKPFGTIFLNLIKMIVCHWCCSPSSPASCRWTT